MPHTADQTLSWKLFSFRIAAQPERRWRLWTKFLSWTERCVHAVYNMRIIRLGHSSATSNLFHPNHWAAINPSHLIWGNSVFESVSVEESQALEAWGLFCLVCIGSSVGLDRAIIWALLLVLLMNPPNDRFFRTRLSVDLRFSTYL